MKGKCHICGKHAKLQAHHIIPRSKYKYSKMKIYLCNECHKNIHKKLDGRKKF